MNGVCGLGEKCCRNTSSGDTNHFDKNGVNTVTNENLFDPSEFKPYDPSQELIFPPELQVILSI